MSALYIIAFAITAALFVYLLYALLKAEDF